MTTDQPMPYPDGYPFGGMGGRPEHCLLCSGPPCNRAIHEDYAAKEEACNQRQQEILREINEHMKVCTGIGVVNHRHGDFCMPDAALSPKAEARKVYEDHMIEHRCFDVPCSTAGDLWLAWKDCY